MKRLQGKTAIVTGGSRGIGRAVALAFAREGARVAITGVSDEAALHAVEAEIAGLGGRALAMLSDAGRRADAAALADRVLADWGRIDILVNNAGILRPALLQDIAEEQWDAVIATHLKGTFNNIQAVLPAMRRGGGGKIINVTAPAALRGSFGVADYAAAKGGIIALTKNAANELRQDNIQVNCISPVADTRMTDALFAFRDGHQSEHKGAAPRRGFVEAEALTPAFVFFATADSDLISGQVLALHPD